MHKEFEFDGRLLSETEEDELMELDEETEEETDEDEDESSDDSEDEEV